MKNRNLRSRGQRNSPTAKATLSAIVGTTASAEMAATAATDPCTSDVQIFPFFARAAGLRFTVRKDGMKERSEAPARSDENR